MAQHLDNTDKFFWPRKNRFPEQFLGDVRALCNTTVTEIVNKQKVTVCLCLCQPWPLQSYISSQCSIMSCIFVPQYAKKAVCISKVKLERHSELKRLWQMSSLRISPQSNSSEYFG